MSSDISITPVGPAEAASVPLPGGYTARGDNGIPVPAIVPVAQASAGADVLQRAAQQVVQAMPGPNKFDFSFDKQTGMTIVRVYNRDTGELVRQIPTEEVVRIAQLMRQEEARPQVLDVTA
jgi:flagellar protein FlaG